MAFDHTSARIRTATNVRLKTVLAKSQLSRDQFLDYILNEALDQIEAEELTYEPLQHVVVVRRELGKPAGESLLSRVSALSHLLGGQSQFQSLRAAEDAPAKKGGKKSAA